MKKTYWISRDSNGNYGIHSKKPKEIGSTFVYYCGHEIDRCLCPKIFKKFFGLERHIPKESCHKFEININVKRIT